MIVEVPPHPGDMIQSGIIESLEFSLTQTADVLGGAAPRYLSFSIRRQRFHQIWRSGLKRPLDLKWIICCGCSPTMSHRFVALTVTSRLRGIFQRKDEPHCNLRLVGNHAGVGWESRIMRQVLSFLERGGSRVNMEPWIGTVFYFGTLDVGVLTDKVPPSCSGVYAYAPFRGLGHLEMGSAIESHGVARCWYRSGSDEVSFDVLSHQGYGQLELANFKLVRMPQI